VHWASADSIALLNHLVCASRDRALIVVVAYRDEEFSGSAALSATVGDLRAQDIRTEAFTLMPLQLQDVRALVDHTFGLVEDSSEALAQITWSRTEGNPFFVRAFLESLHSEGLIRACSEGRWTSISSDREASPRTWSIS
jgi:histidine kinase